MSMASSQTGVFSIALTAWRSRHSTSEMASVFAPRAGLLTALRTGRVSPAVARRAKELGISEIHQGIPDKVETYESLLRRYGLSDEAVAYVGDDLNDLPLLARAGLSAAPADAADGGRARGAQVRARGGG